MISEKGNLSKYICFIKLARLSTKKVVVYSVLRNLARILLSPSSDHAASDADSNTRIGGTAAMLDRLSREDEDITKLLIEWLSGDGIVQDLRIRRAVIAALAENSGKPTSTECLM